MCYTHSQRICAGQSSGWGVAVCAGCDQGRLRRRSGVVMGVSRCEAARLVAPRCAASSSLRVWRQYRLWFWCPFAHPPSRDSGKGGLRSPLSWRCVPVPLLGGVCGRSQQWLRQQAWLCCWQQRALCVLCSACQVSVSAQATRAQVPPHTRASEWFCNSVRLATDHVTRHTNILQ
jgi:hypothetical protein